jgi:hypothetical protein
MPTSDALKAYLEAQARCAIRRDNRSTSIFLAAYSIFVLAVIATVVGAYNWPHNPTALLLEAVLWLLALVLLNAGFTIHSAGSLEDRDAQQLIKLLGSAEPPDQS